MLNILVLESEVKLLNLINTGRKTITSLNEKENEDPHTYFINTLESVPDLEKLLRLNSNEYNDSSLGSKNV